MIKLFCDKPEKKLVNFWNHIVFHPTNAVEKDWGKQHLDKMAEDKAVQIVRIYSMFEENVSLDENGQMQYDFSKNDERIDYLLSKGFIPHIVYGFFPEFLSAEQDESLVSRRYDGDYLCRSYINDYAKWTEICRVYTQHIVDRYGVDQVASWYIHCYNEPDSGHFFYKNAPDIETRAIEYCKLYEGFVAGVTAVSEKLMIGAMGLAESWEHFDFEDYFLAHLRKNNIRIDFLSYHSYGTCPQQITDETRPINVTGAIRNTLMFKQIAKLHGYDHLPMICDEWGLCTSGYDGVGRCADLIIRENEKYAVYFAKMLTYCDDMGLVDPQYLCLSGAHDLQVDFGGHRNFFSKNFYPKPIYNAYVLAARLGQEKLYYYTNKKYQDVSIMPTKHADGHISVLLAYGDDFFKRDLADRPVKIDLSGLDRAYQVKTWRIDKQNANAYTKFLELGSPQDPTEEQKELIRQAGTLQMEDLCTVAPQNPIVELVMENNSVVLLELY